MTDRVPLMIRLVTRVENTRLPLATDYDCTMEMAEASIIQPSLALAATGTLVTKAQVDPTQDEQNDR
jgi:hypothetical protein